VSYKPEQLSYDEIKREIEHVPSTFVPGLTRALIERGLRDVWKGESGLLHFIRNVLAQQAKS
jgi:hypothetical protein